MHRYDQCVDSYAYCITSTTRGHNLPCTEHRLPDRTYFRTPNDQSIYICNNVWVAAESRTETGFRHEWAENYARGAPLGTKESKVGLREYDLQFLHAQS